MSGKPERLIGDDLLAFAGVAPARVLAISKAQQFAEKVHAYTLPRGDRENMRVKDLVDLLLLGEREPLGLEGGTRHMAAQPLEPGAIVRADADSCVQ